MEPTLERDSYIIGNRLYRDIDVGDIIIFEREGTMMVKRVAACEGDSGNTGGITSYYQDENYWYALKFMENRVLSLLGGKAALEVKFGLVDVGANSDMHRAFDLVERFVDNYCMYGFDKFERNNSSQTLLEKKETYVHAELDRYYKQVKQLIVDNMTLLDKLVSALIEKKTITGTDIQMLKTA